MASGTPELRPEKLAFRQHRQHCKHPSRPRQAPRDLERLLADARTRPAAVELPLRAHALPAQRRHLAQELQQTERIWTPFASLSRSRTMHSSRNLRKHRGDAPRRGDPGRAWATSPPHNYGRQQKIRAHHTTAPQRQPQEEARGTTHESAGGRAPPRTPAQCSG